MSHALIEFSQIEREAHKIATIAYGEECATRLITRMNEKLSVEADKMEFLDVLIQDIQSADDSGKVKLTAMANKANTHFRPVDPETFLMHRDFMGLTGQVYPRVLYHFIAMNSGDYQEVVLTGAIGTAKTTLALWSTAYQLYLLSSMINPHKAFGLDRSSEILFIFQSINAQLAKDLEFARFRALLATSRYFTDWFPFDAGIESEMRFPKRIIVRPVSGQETAAIGQNVFGGIIDELNYMSVTEKSKQSVDGGSYDQAIALYNSIVRRRKSRFNKMGKLPGLLCLVSSKRYPGQFTDKKEDQYNKELARDGKSTIYYYDKRPWDVLPEDRFSKVTFDVFVGDQFRKPFIMDEDEYVDDCDEHLVLKVPVDYRSEFEEDIMNALREIGGISTLALHPFFVEIDKVNACFGHHRSVLSREEVDFVTTSVQAYPRLIVNQDAPRWAHVDLALTGDSAGIAIGHVPSFKIIDRGEKLKEMLPNIYFDALLRVNPPKGGEIPYNKIREVFYVLRDLGMNIKWISFDSYQSADNLQILRREGFVTGKVSVDADMIGYNILKGAFYDDRVRAPEHARCAIELAALEKDTEKGKVDHPPAGSKDVSDAMAGVAKGLTFRREIWAKHGVSMREIPETIKQLFVRAPDMKTPL